MANSDSGEQPELGREPSEVTPDGEAPPAQPGRLARFLRSRRGRIALAAIAVAVIVGVLAAIPVTRYSVVGLVVKKDARVAIVDSSTRAPLSGARVVADGVIATTNAKGVATLRGLSVGPHRYRVEKQYYRSSTGTFTIPIVSRAAVARQRLVATGFPLQVTATDRITGAPIVGARIRIGAVQATTDSTGAAAIVLPIVTTAQTGTVAHDGYNTAPISVNVSQRPTSVPITLTGAGTLRYLSKATGTINVMEANLDGTNPAVILAGTGSESDDTTTLLTTTDWTYSALLANRTGKRDALYGMSEGGKNQATLDASASYLTLIGWQGHRFFWEASPIGGAGSTTLRAYDADTGKQTVIDTTKSASGASSYFSSPYLQHGNLVYARDWSGYPPPVGVTADLVAVDTSSLASKTVKSYPSTSNIALQPYQPERLYVRVSDATATSFLSYSYTALTSATISDDKFSSIFPTYLESPSDKATLWAEQRDGKNTIFTGDEDGASPTQLATLSEYTPYGWYGADDRYILLTKNGSELYIAPAGKQLTARNVLKVTDYHKPANSYAGYGSGYGG